MRTPEERKNYMKNYIKKWQKENKDKVKANNKKYTSKPEIQAYMKERKIKYKQENKDKIRAQNKVYRETHKEQIQEWKRNNKGKMNFYSFKRYAILKHAFLSCANQEIMKDIYEQAATLTKETGIKYEVDHIIPLQGKNVCGFHVEWNLQILTKEENRQKRNKLIT